MLDNTISGNRSLTDGGGLYANWTTIELRDNRFWNNSADRTGGAAWVSAGTVLEYEANRPLPNPDDRNDYLGNTPDDIHYMQ